MREFENQAADSWPQMVAALQAGRITEAEQHHRTYCDRFDAAARIRNDLVMAVQAGQPTKRIAESVIPPGVIERLSFRDAAGRLVRVIERSNKTGAA